MGDPLLCRLGFHKWQNYGKQVTVSWNEPFRVGRVPSAYGAQQPLGADGKPPHGEPEAHSEVVYEGKQCKRCGIKLRRKLVTNSDGTLSCVG